jgi:hypothetical protein
MFYEERVVNGVLCYRTAPYEAWRHVHPETMTTRLLKAQEDYEQLKLSTDQHGDTK